MAKNTKPLIIANWKMRLSVKDTLVLAKALVSSLNKYTNQADIVLCPSYPVLPLVADILKGKNIALGAQDVFWKAKGAYTGEVSGDMLKDLGVSYVLVGHSERRQYLKETDQMIQHKVASALSEGLTPVLCVGETFTERQIGSKDVVVARQVERALQGIELNVKDRLVVAYEPVWVIGSGQAVSAAEAEHSALVIKQSLVNLLPSKVVLGQVRLIYGGSVDAGNISDFLPTKVISGVLVGSASLAVDSFTALVKETT